MTFQMTEPMIKYHEDTLRREQVVGDSVLTVGQHEFIERTQALYQEGKTDLLLLQVFKRKRCGEQLFILTKGRNDKSKRTYRFWARGDLHPWSIGMNELELILDLNST